MSRSTCPRFGSGFERLEDREVPAIVFFNVNTTTDTPYDRVENGIPVDAIGATSLRAVVDYANLNPQTGNPSANNYMVTINGGTITLDPNLGTLVIFSNMSLIGVPTGPTVEEGPPAPATTVRRWGTNVRFGLFQVEDNMHVSFSNMTLQGGETYLGGAIKVDPNAHLSVEGCDLVNNHAPAGALDTEPGHGGAIYASPGSTLWINHSMLGLNKAEDAGGAIYAYRAAGLTIHASAIIGNEATGAGAFGGGLYIEDTNTEIDDTDIIGNEATGNGGGLYFFASLVNRNLNMNGGQFYGNTAGGHGGGLYVDANGQTVTLTDVSVTQNSAGGKGGGHYVRRGTLAGSLTALTGNTATQGIPGIARHAGGGTVTITVPPNEQSIETDNDV